jgi:hypothetical protein
MVLLLLSAVAFCPSDFLAFGFTRVSISYTIRATNRLEDLHTGTGLNGEFALLRSNFLLRITGQKREEEEIFHGYTGNERHSSITSFLT